MSDTAAARLRRLLHLIPRLADENEHSLAEIAERMNVGPEAVLADLAALTERYDAPAGFVEGVQIYIEGSSVSVTTSHFLRPMRLTMQELRALELGLSLLRRERAPDEVAPVDRALDRLRAVITNLPANDAQEGLHVAELASGGRVDHLAIVRQALRERRKVRLVYRGGGAEESTSRVVCPFTVVFARGMWYVVAHCETSDGVRIFRLDRIEQVEMLAATFKAPDPSTVERVLRDGQPFHADAPPMMTVRYSPRVARWIAEREGVAVDADGSLTLEHPLADVSWGVRHVLQYGPDAEVLAPVEMRAAVASRLEKLAS